MEKNNQLTRGLAFGQGYIFPYLDVETQKELFTMAEINSEFAIGLGEGLGSVFSLSTSKISEKRFQPSRI